MSLAEVKCAEAKELALQGICHIREERALRDLKTKQRVLGERPYKEGKTWWGKPYTKGCKDLAEAHEFLMRMRPLDRWYYCLEMSYPSKYADDWLDQLQLVLAMASVSSSNWLQLSPALCEALYRVPK
jgi:hypothetical protein